MRSDYLSVLSPVLLHSILMGLEQIVKRNADDLVAMIPVGTLDRVLTRVYTQYIPLFGDIRSADKTL